MSEQVQIALIGVCKDIVQDGILTNKEIVGLARWINAHPEVKEGWPGKILVRMLKAVFADKKISKAESRDVGAALQNIIRQWDKERSKNAIAEKSKDATNEVVLDIEVVDAYDVLTDKNAAWRIDPPTERQMEFAKSLGITFESEISKGQLSDLISVAVGQRDNLPATDYQRRQAIELEVEIPENATNRQADDIIKAARPTWEQRRLFEMSGLEFPEGANKETVDVEINRLKDDPEIKKRIKAAEERQQLEFIEAEKEYRQEEIERHGLEVVEEFERWEKLIDEGDTLVVIFRSGKNLKVDVIEIEDVEIEKRKRGKSRVMIDCLLPKKVREDGYTYLEWEKERRLDCSKIEFVQALKEAWGSSHIDEVGDYNDLKDQITCEADKLTKANIG